MPEKRKMNARAKPYLWGSAWSEKQKPTLVWKLKLDVSVAATQKSTPAIPHENRCRERSREYFYQRKTTRPPPRLSLCNTQNMPLKCRERRYRSSLDCQHRLLDPEYSHHIVRMIIAPYDRSCFVRIKCLFVLCSREVDGDHRRCSCVRYMWRVLSSAESCEQTNKDTKVAIGSHWSGAEDIGRHRSISLSSFAFSYCHRGEVAKCLKN